MQNTSSKTFDDFREYRCGTPPQDLRGNSLAQSDVEVPNRCRIIVTCDTDMIAISRPPINGPGVFKIKTLPGATLPGATVTQPSACLFVVDCDDASSAQDILNKLVAEFGPASDYQLLPAYYSERKPKVKVLEHLPDFGWARARWLYDRDDCHGDGD